MLGKVLAVAVKRWSGTGIVAGIFVLQVVGIWVLLASRDQIGAGGPRLLIVLGATMALAAALYVREHLVNRSASSDTRFANDRLRLAMESGKAVAWDWDVRTGRDVWFGDLKTMFGMSEDIFEGRVEDFRARVHPDDREIVWKAVAQARQDRTMYRAKFRLALPDGTVRWASATGKFYYAANGEAIRMLGIAADITELSEIEDRLNAERKRADAALRDSEERFRLMADTAPVLLWMSGIDKRCHYFNRSWLEFTGRPMEAELGNGWTEGVHPGDLKQCLDIYERAFDRRDRFRMEYRLRRHDGEYRWVLDTGVPRLSADGAFSGYIGSCVDVTEHKLAARTLSGLSHRLMEAQEKERAWIARELHDDVAQRMALLTIELERLSQVLPRGAVEARIRVNELCGRAIDLGKDIQVISHRLHSSKLEYLGIASAAGAFCRELSEQQGVTIAFSHTGVPEDLPKEVALALFRVLQEALTNAVKHAGVSHFSVELRGEAGEIQLEVVDTGIGFDPKAALGSHGLGLVSMQERLHLVHGEIAIDSRPGAGTRMRARVPLGVPGALAVGGLDELSAL